MDDKLTQTLSFQLAAQKTPQGIFYLSLKPADAADDAPTVLVLHGLGRSKEHMLPTLYAFARAGYQAVALDARLHGERPQSAQRDTLLQAQYVPTLYDMIAGTAQDIPPFLDALGVSRAAVHGVSLGGYIAFAAMVREPRLAVASVAMGSPDWLEGMRALGLGPGHPVYDQTALGNPLHHAPATYPPRPLLMLHGDQDEIVPVQGVRDLYQDLLPVYQDAPDTLKLTVYPGLGHRYTDEMVEQSVDWTCRFLPG